MSNGSGHFPFLVLKTGYLSARHPLWKHHCCFGFFLI